MDEEIRLYPEDLHALETAISGVAALAAKVAVNPVTVYIGENSAEWTIVADYESAPPGAYATPGHI